MIAIVSSNTRERAAFAALCASRAWICGECESLRALKRLVKCNPPKVVLTRHRLDDGYSDDVIALLRATGALAGVKVIVLFGAGAPASLEARQIALGADCVQRDPVRADLVVEYVGKFLAQTKRSRSKNAREGRNSFRFAGAIVDPIERSLRHGVDDIHLTPREVELIELLREFQGLFVTYEVLYGEILGRRFRGETGNMRVLLGKLAASFRAVGLPLRQHIDVMPKTGYRYRERRTAARAQKARS
ncbi:MAG: hypothetical protein ABIR80_06805 [Opitutaceae bacterium]